MIQTVLKRDGRVVGFNEEKIATAIRKAMLHTDKGEDLVEDTINYTISFNGKARFNMEFPADETSEVIQSTVLADERSAKWMEGKSVVKVIVVPKKIVNIVIK